MKMMMILLATSINSTVLRAAIRTLVVVICIKASTIMVSSSVTYDSSTTIKRFEDILSPCLVSDNNNADLFYESFLSNELDRTSPLSFAFFGKNQSYLDTISQALDQVLFKTPDTQHLVLDLSSVIVTATPTSAELYQHMKKLMMSHVEQNPSRSLITLRNVQAISGKLLPSLDVLLDALGGSRARLANVDFRNAIVILLFKDDKVTKKNENWRSVLENHWKFNGPEFTPSAVIGRIGGAVVISDNDNCNFKNAVGEKGVWNKITATLSALALVLTTLVLVMSFHYPRMTTTTTVSTELSSLPCPNEKKIGGPRTKSRQKTGRRRRSKSTKRRKSTSSCRRSSRLQALSQASSNSIYKG